MEGGSLRLCEDWKKLTAVTVRDSFSVPRVDECIDSLRNGLIFLKLDADCSYWVVKLDNADCDKTASVSRHRLFKFWKITFELHNAPGTFKRTMDVALSKMKWSLALVYLDDIIIISENADKHISHVPTVLSLSYKAGVTLNLNKCNFFSEKIDYLWAYQKANRIEASKPHYRRYLRLRSTAHRSRPEINPWATQPIALICP